MRNVRGGNARPVSVFEDDHGGRLELDAGDIRDVKILPVSVFENDHHRSMVVGRRGASPGHAADRGNREQGKNPECFSRLAHDVSPSEPGRVGSLLLKIWYARRKTFVP